MRIWGQTRAVLFENRTKWGLLDVELPDFDEKMVNFVEIPLSIGKFGKLKSNDIEDRTF